MMYAHLKFHHNWSVQVLETELNTLSKLKSGYVQQSVKIWGKMEINAVGRRKFGYVQQSVLGRSRTDLYQLRTLELLKLCLDVCLCEV